jgi:hypothetical protein
MLGGVKPALIVCAQDGPAGRDPPEHLELAVRLGLACVSGYVSGLAAFVFLPLFSIHGWQRFTTLPRNSGELVGLLLSPLLTLIWLVALLAWLVAWVVWKKWSNKFAGICISMTALGLLLLCH